MSETTNRIAGLIAGSINDKLPLAGENQLKEWAAAHDLNRSLLLALSSEEERNKRIARYKSAGSEAIWNKIRQKAKDEIGYEIGAKPSPPRFSPAARLFLISVTVSVVMAVAALVYITVSNINKKEAPGRTVQKSNYRF